MAELARIQRWLASHAWAMLPDAYGAMVEIVGYRVRHGQLSADDLAERVQTPRGNQPLAAGGVMVVPVHGPIVPRANLLDDISGAVSAEKLGSTVDAAAADPDVKAVLLDIDSPGGSVHGLTELAGRVFEARAAKPIVAIVRYTAASAAYWLASQASEIVMSPSAQAGSIGVFAEHWDESGENELLGLRPTLISAGKYKVEGNPNEPLSDDARAMLQRMVDGHYAVFTADVARGRGVTPEAVRGGFGEGRLLLASDALREGLADREDTFTSTLARLQRPQGRGAIRRVAADADADFRLRAELELLKLTA